MKKKNAEPDEIIEAEEIPLEEAIVKIDEAISNKLIKRNVTEAILSKIEKDYSDLTINGVQDKAGYSRVHEARIHCKNIRVAAIKLCKEGRAMANLEVDRWISRQNAIVDRVKKVEEPLLEKEKGYDDEVDRINREKKEKAELQAMRRTEELFKMGATYDGVNFVLNEVRYDAVLAKTVDDSIYNAEIYSLFRTEWDKIESERIRIENEKKAEDERIRQEREKLEREKREFEQKQLEAKKQQEDEAEKKRQIEYHKKLALIKNRSITLSSLGIDYDYNSDSWIGYGYTVPEVDISGYSEDDWNKMIEDLKPAIERAKEKENAARIAKNEQEKREAIERDRKEQEQKRLREEQQKKEEEERRLAEAKDIVKWKAVIEYLEKCPLPEMVSGPYRAKIKKVKDFLAELK